MNANRKSPLDPDCASRLGVYFRSNPLRFVGSGDGTVDEADDQDRGAVRSEDKGNKNLGVVDEYVNEERAGYASSVSGGV